MGKKNLRLKARIILEYGTQADFAEALDVNECWISKVVTMRRYLPIEKEREWAAMLNCKRIDIF